MKIKNTILDFSMITLGIAIVSSAVYFFLIPSSIPVGSITSLAMVLATFIPLKISFITLILNVGLLILGFLFIGREFGAKTVYTSIMMPVILGLLEILFPGYTSVMGDPFVDMICYIFVVCAGQALLFNRNASSGGLDIVAKFLNKYLRMELGKAMALGGFCVALSAVFVYDVKTVILSLLGTYLSGLVLDHFIFGSNIKKRVCIISRKEEEIKTFILNTLHSGATIYEAMGAYDGQTRREIITILYNHEYRQLMDFLARTDSDAFVTVYTVSEVYYRPKILPPPADRS